MSLSVILGPMCSGKTSQLILEASKSFSIHKKKVLLVTCSLDTRDLKNKISTHFEYFKDLDKIFDIITLEPDQFKVENIPLENYSLVCIDETQFFKNTWETVAYLKSKTHVICAGLKADCFEKPFGDFLNLISLADEVVMLKAICSHPGCMKKAAHTKRLIGGADLIIIGGTDLYSPVCSEHF